MNPSPARRELVRRWIGLGLVALVLVLAFVRLGAWQLGRAHRPYAERLAGVVALDQVSRLGQALPDSAVGSLVTATGHYDVSQEELVVRPGSDRLWVLTPLRLDDGSALAVVRGSVPASRGAPLPPPGVVKVTGALEPSEAPAPAPSTSAGRLGSITTEQLVAQWPYSIRDGYLILTAQEPASQLTPVSVPPVLRTGGLRWQNLTYAIQWWLFAVFTVFLFLRIVVDDRRRLAQPGPDGSAAGGPGSGPGPGGSGAGPGLGSGDDLDPPSGGTPREGA